MFEVFPAYSCEAVNKSIVTQPTNIACHEKLLLEYSFDVLVDVFRQPTNEFHEDSYKVGVPLLSSIATRVETEHPNIILNQELATWRR